MHPAEGNWQCFYLHLIATVTIKLTCHFSDISGASHLVYPVTTLDGFEEDTVQIPQYCVGFRVLDTGDLLASNQFLCRICNEQKANAG